MARFRSEMLKMCYYRASACMTNNFSRTSSWRGKCNESRAWRPIPIIANSNESAENDIGEY